MFARLLKKAAEKIQREKIRRRKILAEYSGASGVVDEVVNNF